MTFSPRPSLRLILLSLFAATTWLVPVASSNLAWIPWAACGAVASIAAIDFLLSRKGSLSVSALEAPPLQLRRNDSHTIRFILQGIRSDRVLRLLPATDAGLSLQAVERARTDEGDTPCWAVTLRADQRGRHALTGVRVEALSKLGIWFLHTRLPLHLTVHVFPDTRKTFRQLKPSLLSSNLHGMHHTRVLGKGREFEKLREYVQGDAVADIHWKASAKRNKLVTKEFQIERTQEVYIAIDHSRLSAGIQPGGGTLLESYLAAAVAFQAVLARQGDRIGWVTFAEIVTSVSKARAGLRQSNAFQQAVHDIRPRSVSPDFLELVTTIINTFRRRAFLVILTDLRDPVIAERLQSLLPVLGRQHVVRVMTPCDSSLRPVFSRPVTSSAEVYADIVSHLHWRELQILKRKFQTIGTPLVLSGHERFATDLMNTYLTARRRQLV